jgi:hypothetical protein
MTKATAYSQNDSTVPPEEKDRTDAINRKFRACPSCGLLTLVGMPGGRDAICKNCGFKDPCCGDA